jgi:hypothetical protein
MKMNALYNIIIIISIGCNNVFSQTYITQVKMMENDLWGYINQKGEFIFEPRFDRASEFSKEGLVAIYDVKSEKYFFINIHKAVLPVEIYDFRLLDAGGYADPKGFEDGLIPVEVENKWGFINTSGKVAIPIKYKRITAFNGGYASAKCKRKNYVLDTLGNEILVNDKNVKVIKSFSEQLAPFVSRDKKLGFIDNNGKVILKPKFESVGYFNAGLAWVRLSYDMPIGYINTKGEWAIEPKFTTAKNFDPESGMALVKIGETWFYVNKEGQMLFMNTLATYGDFSEGLAYGREYGKYGFFNNKGEWIIPPQFNAVRDFKNGFAAVRVDDKWGVIDKKGNWVIKPFFRSIKDMELVEVQ